MSDSIGSLINRSKSALRGWNHARSLFEARSAMNWMPSGENPANVVVTATLAPPAAPGVYAGSGVWPFGAGRARAILWR